MISSNTWPIDLARLRKLLGPTAEEEIPSILPIFLEEVSKWVARLREALDAEDLSQLTQAAHALKGNNHSMAVISMADLAAEIYQLGKQGGIAQITPKVILLEEEYEKVRAALIVRWGTPEEHD